MTLGPELSSISTVGNASYLKASCLEQERTSLVVNNSIVVKKEIYFCDY